ncbi:MAG: hypothetical protein ACI808_000526 [Paraglaciecola sp.]|jgi:hypothetical protein
MRTTVQKITLIFRMAVLRTMVTNEYLTDMGLLPYGMVKQEVTLEFSRYKVKEIYND